MRVHAGPRGCLCGTPRGRGRGQHMEGPRVSGPSLGVWGGSANALPHSTFYTNDSLVFIQCGTMSRVISPVQATWTRDRR